MKQVSLSEYLLQCAPPTPLHKCPPNVNLTDYVILQIFLEPALTHTALGISCPH